MKTIARQHAKRTGFSLIEVLVSMSVVALGLLAVVSFQSRLTAESGESKAKVEATALAQARIEELRNYTNSARTVDEFNALFTAGNEGADTSITGVNSTFNRSEAFTTNGNRKQVNVQVAWTDRGNNSHSVVLSAELGWESPRSVGDIGRDTTIAHVGSPTGRAHLGEGQLPPNATTTPNDDGTEIYDDGSGDLKLVVGNDIVLTLEDACQNGSCLNFVKIKGRIYIDTATQSQLDPGEVFVKASDAAYCQRYYVTYDGAGNPTAHPVDNNTTSALTTASGDYEYFDYTCYLGGGWHGNIGILLAGGIAQSDKFCQGDPVTTDAWAEPVIAARRAYRGMLYKVDASTANGKQQNANGDNIYYSIGVGDAIVLPDPDTSDKTHDFVIASLAVSATEGSNCKTQGIMVRPDSVVGGVSGALFEGIPTDFVCLNPSYIDSFDSTVYGVENTCPYDPTDPPAARHILSGTIDVVADVSQAANVELISVNTSDGPGNCTRGVFSFSGAAYSATYTCDVYDWGNGWNGYIQINPNSYAIACNDDGSIDGLADQRMNMTSIGADGSGKDFGCAAGNIVVVTGTVTSGHTNRKLSSASISIVGGSCLVDADGMGYSCTTGVFDTETWTGTITFTPASGKVCGTDVNPTTGVATLTNLAPGIYTRDLWVNHNTSCP